MVENRYFLALLWAINHASAILESECGGSKEQWKQSILTEAIAFVDGLSEEELAAYYAAILEE